KSVSGAVLRRRSWSGWYSHRCRWYMHTVGGCTRGCCSWCGCGDVWEWLRRELSDLRLHAPPSADRDDRCARRPRSGTVGDGDPDGKCAAVLINVLDRRQGTRCASHVRGCAVAEINQHILDADVASIHRRIRTFT